MTHAIVTGDKSLITEGAGKALYTFPITGAPASQYMPVTTLADESGNTVDYATTTPGSTAVGVVTRIAGTAKVDGSAVTQPVSIAGTVGISAASLPLPTGAATSSNQTSGSQVTQIVGPSGNAAALSTPGDAQPGTLGGLWTNTRLHVYNGTTYDVARGDTTSGQWVNVKNASLPVTGTFFQATQPVSLTTLPALVAGSAVIGAVKMIDAGGVNTATVKAASTLAVATDTAQVVAVRDTITNNLSQVGGSTVSLVPLPTGADGQASLPVSINSIQKLTYDVASRNLITSALTANTAKAVLSFEHAAISTKTVRIRRISVHAIQTTALSGAFDIQITRGTAASTAGTNNTPVPRKTGDAAAECLVRTLPTIVAATVGDSLPAGGFATTTTLYSPPVLVFDWQEGGEMKPYILRAGVLESFVINVISTAAHNLTLTISVDFTEE